MTRMLWQSLQVVMQVRYKIIAIPVKTAVNFISQELFDYIFIFLS